jgi:hypothetical protein
MPKVFESFACLLAEMAGRQNAKMFAAQYDRPTSALVGRAVDARNTNDALAP